VVGLRLPGRDLTPTAVGAPGLTTRWGSVPLDAYEWREWDGEAAVFVHATGDTHALSADASALLAAMRNRLELELPASEWLALALEAGASDEGYEDVLMQGLETIGLVRPTTP